MQKKTIRKVLLHTLATGLFLFVLSLNLTVSLNGQWGIGFNKVKADVADESKKYVLMRNMMGCDDFTATQQIVSNSTGQVGLTLNLGTKLGTYSAGVNPGHTGTTTTTMELQVHYPKNPDGSVRQYEFISCMNGGTESCKATAPCRDIALGLLGIQP